MILDATAGNRVIWQNKESEHVIYMDVERNLEVKPTIIADNSKPPFREHSFTTIIFDPPYCWGNIHPFYMYPNKQEQLLHNPERNRAPTYYGTDKYKSHTQLISYLYRTSQAFSHCLTEHGLLWLKWNEMVLPLNNILPIFESWTELLRLPIGDTSQTMSNTRTYWVCMAKNGHPNQTLDSYSTLEQA